MQENTIDSIQKRLQKFGFSHLLELAFFAPYSYTNTILLQSLENGAEGALEVEVIKLYGHSKLLKVDCNVVGLDEYIQIIFFHPKPYHKKLFFIGKRVFIQGKINYKFNQYSIIQPKIIQSVGTIKAEFKISNHKSKALEDFTKEVIIASNLESLGIEPQVAEAIEEIFHPNLVFFKQYVKRGGFFGQYLYALKYVEIFYHFLMLSKKRLFFEAKFCCNGSYDDLLQNFPFNLTNAQKRVIDEIAKDLNSKKAAKRLIMGDVGCGKTMVILASVMIAYPQKSLLMAPTTILAKQLYEQAMLYLPRYINIELITSESKRRFQGLFAQDAHFIIGTQALLYSDIQSENLALVMSDEQHRFGTKQRFYLEKLATSHTTSNPKKPHILQFSATPIPRTMAMLESNLIDVSIIDEVPFKKDITTKIISKPDFNGLLAHISSEIAKDNQVAIIYPLVEESEVIDYMSLTQGASFWQRHFEGVFVTSGQDKEKESALERFANEGNILLATTLIEVGISLPKLSTIVIIAPERLGLATLHQLRGRVSRNGLKGFCFLYTHNPQSERLVEFVKHTSGFEIAELDLKYRKAGDILSGKKQSGEQWRWVDLSEDCEIFTQVKKVLKS